MNRLKGLWSRLRRITKINLIIGTIAALVFSYIAVTAYFGTASQVRYTSNDFPGAKRAASVFLHLSPVQRHIGYFNRGTAEAAVGDYDAAQADLEAALEIAPASAECAVRINLSFVYEKQADEVAGEDPEQSQELYDRSLKTLEDAPKECQPDESEEKQKSETAKERVEDKKEDSQDESSDDEETSDGDEQQGSEDEESEDSGNKSEREKKREELEERGEESERHQHEQGPRGNGGRSTPEKPW